MRRLSQPFRDALTAKGADFHRYADLPMARRLSAALWVAGVVLGLAIFAVSPPAARDSSGWIAFAVIGLGGAFTVRRLLDERREVGGTELLIGSYMALLSVGVLDAFVHQRLYARIMLLSIVFVAVTQPPRRVILFYLAALVVSMHPAIAGYADARAEDIVGDGLLWLIVCAVATAWTTSVHAARREAALENADARRAARLDKLTELPNRRAFEETFAQELTRARRSNNELTLAMVDLDDFKSVNDSSGHLAGDELLRSVGQALAANSRGGDHWFRWGGDEFVGLLLDTDEATAVHVMARIADAIAESCERPDGGGLGIQVGIAALEPEMGDGDLLPAADAAVLRAKVPAPMADLGRAG